MKKTFCDTCQELIKNKDSKYIFVVFKVAEEEGCESTETILESFKESPNAYGRSLKTYEICQSCKTLLEHFFTLRTQEIKQQKNEIAKLLNEDPQREIEREEE